MCSAEGALQPLWLAKIFYPEIFTDINLEEEVKKFYLKFYRYELSDEELKEILNPKFSPRSAKRGANKFSPRRFCVFINLSPFGYNPPF